MRWRSAQRATSAIVAATLLLGASGGRAAPMPWPTIKSTLPGFELRYPPGWHATLRSDNGIAISTFKLAQPDSFPARPRGSAYLFIFDYGHVPKPLPPRPAHIHLPPIASYEGFGSGSMLNFPQAGHNFQIFVGFGQGADAATRSLAVRTVASLRTTAPPLANDEKTIVLGRSVQGRPIRAFHYGDFASHSTILVVGCIHGTECAGMAVTQQLLGNLETRANLWVIQDLNPDGLHAGTRVNADGVDLNRNFSTAWQSNGQRGDPQYAGPRRSQSRKRGSLATWSSVPACRSRSGSTSTPTWSAPGAPASPPPAATPTSAAFRSRSSTGSPEAHPTGRTTASRVPHR